MSWRKVLLTGALAAAFLYAAGRAQEAGSQLRLIPSEIDALSQIALTAFSPYGASLRAIARSGHTTPVIALKRPSRNARQF